MTRNTTELWVLPLAILSGCVDLGLLDELIPFDAAAEQGGSTDVDGDSDADADGPPATDADDVTAPALVPISCGGGEDEVAGCCVAAGNGTVGVRLSTDEPAAIEVTAPEGVRAEVVSDPWSQEHLVVAVGLPASVESVLELSIADVNGNSAACAISAGALDGPAAAVTEVLADPLGPEPAQEFVEIANYGGVEIDLSGWMIDDNGDANGDVLPAGCVIPPGEVALLVSPEYDPASAEDTAPVAGALIIYLEGSLGTSGLKNDAAETLELYDAAGDLVSTYDARLGDPVEGRSAARVRAEVPDGCTLAFGATPISTPTPGAAPFVP